MIRAQGLPVLGSQFPVLSSQYLVGRLLLRTENRELRTNSGLRAVVVFHLYGSRIAFRFAFRTQRRSKIKVKGGGQECPRHPGDRNRHWRHVYGLRLDGERCSQDPEGLLNSR